MMSNYQKNMNWLNVWSKKDLSEHIGGTSCFSREDAEWLECFNRWQSSRIQQLSSQQRTLPVLAQIISCMGLRLEQEVKVTGYLPLF